MTFVSVTPVLNVADVPASLAWFERLGWKRTFTWNDSGILDGAADSNERGPADFAGVCCGAVTFFLCQDGQGSRGSVRGREGVWSSLWLGSPAEVDETFASAKAAGCAVDAPPRDEPWGVREFVLIHPDGHCFRISASVEGAS